MFFMKTSPTVSVDLIDRPPHAFTIRAAQSPSFDLVITVYYSLNIAELIAEALLDLFGVGIFATVVETAIATLSSLDAPLKVVQEGKVLRLLPDAPLVDASQEPTYALIETASLSGNLAAPPGYGFWAQELIAGEYFQP